MFEKGNAYMPEMYGAGQVSRIDLTGYAALLGEGLSSKVGLLERLLADAHYPSLGSYKERLLANTIRDFLPRTVEVGTGFVLFPHAHSDPLGGPDLHDPLNQSAFSVSRQCDILVYDVARFPAVFRDGDFVVVRPEAVRAVIEVKGSLTIPETRSALDSFHDFATKWRGTQLFYLGHHQSVARAPGLFLMAWQIKKTRAGHPVATPSRIREIIAEFYSQNLTASEADGYPLLQQLFIYNETEITNFFDLSQPPVCNIGWTSLDGRFVRANSDGTLFRGQDRTIASLLASLHMAVAEEDFNRFFSRPGEVSNQNIPTYEYSGKSLAWLDVEDAGVFVRGVPQPKR